MIHLSDGNSKLVKTNGDLYKILGWGIPADHTFTDKTGQVCNTCPGACACAAVCYAKQGRYRMPNVHNAKVDNLNESLNDTFVDNMVALLEKRRTYNTVRVHDAGDFYNQEYLEKWYAIASKLKGEYIFYAYTKALNLDLYTNKPSNFRLIQSLGGKYDSLVDMSKPHSRIFSTHEARISAAYVDGSENDLPAIEGDINIGLVYHGVKKLTLPQVKFFS